MMLRPDSKVSFFLPAKTKDGRYIPGTNPTKDISYGEYFTGIKTGVWRNYVEEVRNNGADKCTVPGITPAVTLAYRNSEAKNIKARSGVIALDFDNDDDHFFPIDEIAADPYVWAVHKTVSGKPNRYAVYVRYDTGKEHLKVFLALEKYFFDNYGLAADPSCKDLPRFRFVSWDPELHINQSPKSWSIELEEKRKVYSGSGAGPTTGEATRPGDDYNAKMNPVKLLESYGWTFVRESGERVFMRRPGKTTAKQSGNYHKRFNSFYCQTSSTKLPERAALNAFAIYTHWEHSGDFTAAAKALYAAGYGERQNKRPENRPQQSKSKRSAHIERIAAMQRKQVGISGGHKDKAAAAAAAKTILKDTDGVVGEDVEAGVSAVMAMSNEAFKKSMRDNDTQKGEFWTVTTYTKGEKEFEKISWAYQAARKFLQAQGFHKYEVNTIRRFVRKLGKVVSQVDPVQIRNFMAAYAEDGDFLDGRVLEMILRAGHQYLGESQLSFMYAFEGAFMQPENDIQRIYFKTKYWEITSFGVVEKELSELPAHIWESQCLDFDPELLKEPIIEVGKVGDKFGFNASTDFQKCHIAEFLFRTSCFDWQKFFKLQETKPGRKEYKPNGVAFKASQKTNDHFVAKVLALGYLLYSYRDKSETKAVVCMDGEETEVGASEGGTGKSIFGQIPGYVVSSVKVDGKKRNLTEDKFIYQEVDERTQILFFDDCRTNLDFEHFFSQITSRIDVEGKGIPKYSLPAPKFIFTTNHALNGEGNSFNRRQYLLAFSDWYNQYRTPKDDFGCVLFDDWGSDQWNLFYNFIARCLQAYLTFGFRETVDNRDLEKRKLKQQMNEAFLDWADLYYSTDAGNIGKEIDKHTLYEHFSAKCPQEVKWTKITAFKKKLKKFCKYKAYKFNPSQNGGDNKKSGVEYIVIAAPGAG